ncbi:hypothetical protein C0992_011791, partial [Termitomyces sp. T32_za158]
SVNIRGYEYATSNIDSTTANVRVYRHLIIPTTSSVIPRPRITSDAVDTKSIMHLTAAAHTIAQYKPT